MRFTPLLVHISSATAAAVYLQSQGLRVAYFIGGVLIALFPLIVFGALGVILIRLYLRSRSAQDGGS